MPTPDSPPRPAGHAAPAASGPNLELAPAGGRKAVPGSVVRRKRGLSGTDSELRTGSEAMPRSRESRKEARSVKGPLSRNHSDAKTLAASSGDGGGGGQRPRRVVSACVRDVFWRQAPARGRPESPLRYDGGQRRARASLMAPPNLLSRGPRVGRGWGREREPARPAHAPSRRPVCAAARGCSLSPGACCPRECRQRWERSFWIRLKPWQKENFVFPRENY